MDFQVFHMYNRLVSMGKAKPLLCPYCDNEFTLRLGKDDEPVLQCFYCNSLTTPGLNLYNSIKAVVEEHYV